MFKDNLKKCLSDISPFSFFINWQRKIVYIDNQKYILKDYVILLYAQSMASIYLSYSNLHTVLKFNSLVNAQ